jgi:hypothetical protein
LDEGAVLLKTPVFVEETEVMLGLTATKFFGGIERKVSSHDKSLRADAGAAAQEPLAQRLFRVAVAMLRQPYNNDQKV